MTIIHQLVFLCLFAGCFFAPGWLALKALNVRRHRFLLSLSLSYVWLVAALTVVRFAKLPVAGLAPFILGGAVVFGALWLSRFIAPRFCRDGSNCSLRSYAYRSRPGFRFKPGFRFRPGILVPFAVVMGLLWAYLWWAGPYLEIPSDAWNHIWYLRHIQGQINAGQCGETDASLYRLLARQGPAWYLMAAYLTRWSGLSTERVLMPLTIMTVSTFCAGIFFCALAVFRPFRVSVWKKGWLAAGATLLCAGTMGTSVFAYIRYYAFAPTILNYLLFLGATLVALDWFNVRKWRTIAVWLVPALILTMNIIHSQEALFACFMIMGLALVNVCKGIFRHGRICLQRTNPPGQGTRPTKICVGPVPSPGVLKGAAQSALFIKSLVVAGIAIIAWLGLFFYLRHKNPIIWPTADTIMPNMPIPPISVPLFFKALTISAPSHPVVRLFVYQFYTFYQTIACWGFFVYLVFLLGFRQMAKSNYLLAGMAMPLLTVFNPITIDLFVRLVTLHHSPGMPPVTIWRFAYMLPLPFVAALAFGSAVKSLRQRKGRPDEQVSIKPFGAARIKGILVILGLLGFIFPIQNRWIDAPFSRVFTLAKDFGNDTGRWRDLTDFVAGFQNPMLITDPNTCQIFSRLYPEYPACGLLWMDSDEPEKQFLETIERQPDLRTRGIVIINRRDGVPSVTGRISMHWAEDAFLTSHFFSSNAIAFVESQTNSFKLLWAKDRIAVYRIMP